MKYFLLAVLGLVSFSHFAIAADKTDGISSGIAVERILCKQGKPTSSANYTPGVDVNGKPVTPADGGSVVPIQSHYTEVPLNVDLNHRLNLPQVSEAQMAVATLRIYDDGRVLYNGQDISQQTSALCAGKTPPAMVPGSVPPAQTVTTMPTLDVPMPGSAAPSATSNAR